MAAEMDDFTKTRTSDYPLFLKSSCKFISYKTIRSLCVNFCNYYEHINNEKAYIYRNSWIY